MKKKIVCFIIVFAFILACAICLSGCDKEVKHYYTEEIAEHCEIVYSSQAYDDKGNYVLDGEGIEFNISVEDGYYSNDLKLLINSDELPPTSKTEETYDDLTITHRYYYSYTPTGDFTIKAIGNFTKVVKQFTMSKTEWYEEENTDNRDLFIRFNSNSYGLPTEETVYADFVRNRLDIAFTRNVPFGEGISFDVYYKGTDFIGDPSVADGPFANCSSDFYHTGNEIGYHFTFVQRYENSYITFDNFTAQRTMQIMTSNNSGIQNSLESDKLDITFPEAGSKTLTITLKDRGNIPAKTLSGLRLMINGENQNVDFTADSNGGIFEITLKNPWEYGDRYNTYYEIDLNFYEFSYFDGIVEIPNIE